MEILLREADLTSLSQINQSDGAFTVTSKLVLQAKDGAITYTVEPVMPYVKRYPPETFDYTTFLNNPDKAIYFAYVDGELAGQIVLWKNWNGYAYINDIAVDARCRRLGIGRRLIDRAVEWAKSKGLPGLMLETQNINVGACLLYAGCGFHIGGFDNDLYKVTDPGTSEVAIYWYMMFS